MPNPFIKATYETVTRVQYVRPLAFCTTIVRFIEGKLVYLTFLWLVSKDNKVYEKRGHFTP